jgi:hypothetical protein
MPPQWRFVFQHLPLISYLYDPCSHPYGHEPV